VDIGVLVGGSDPSPNVDRAVPGGEPTSNDEEPRDREAALHLPWAGEHDRDLVI